MVMKLEHPPSIQYTGPFRDDSYIVLGSKIKPSYLTAVFFFWWQKCDKVTCNIIPPAPMVSVMPPCPHGECNAPLSHGECNG